MKKKVLRSKKKDVAKSKGFDKNPTDDLIKAISSLKDELKQVKKGHNDLVEFITAKEQADKRVDENKIDVLEKSDGLMDKKIGTASLGDIVTIAKAYLEQSRQEQNQANSPDGMFAEVGKNAFSQWIESAFGKNFKSIQQEAGVQ
tara:strand:- start:121 stop:555 length:435 start_codon:yes stop_codon:yes gene_type:complete